MKFLNNYMIDDCYQIERDLGSGAQGQVVCIIDNRNRFV